MHTKKLGSRFLSMCLVLTLLVSTASISVFAANDSSSVSGYENEAVITLDDLADINEQLGSADEVDVYTDFYEYLYEADYDGSEELVMADGAIYLLLYGGMSMNQIVNEGSENSVEWSEIYEFDNNEDRIAMYYYNAYYTALNMGILDGVDYMEDSALTYSDFSIMLDNTAVLYDALHDDEVSQLFVNGAAQPIFSYDNIVRFCVYVETNYDTDGDGQLDLVKVLVQMPGEAIDMETGEIKMELSSIYEARPYITGCTDRIRFDYGTDGYDLSSMYSQPAARTPQAEGSTLDAINATSEDDYYYYNWAEPIQDYEDLTWYDYFIVRGYAVVECGGLGTLGSDGFETCGTDLEIDAFKCVIEWLAGNEDRVAYIDHDNSYTTVSADWSTGKVGMTGRSYAGTTQFGLATTGVEGLETIVPVAGIASWYEYTNSQGVSTSYSVSYSDSLALTCAGRLLGLETLNGENTILFDNYEEDINVEDYANYLGQVKSDQILLNGDYGVDGVYQSTDPETWYLNQWSSRDYTLDWENIQCPALIVHGLNDTNVNTKEFDLMYQAYEKAGVDAKLLLHQGTHLTPTYDSGGYAITVGEDEMSYDELLNRWFCYYLYDIDNGITDMADVTVQSNIDGSWTTYDSWGDVDEYVLEASGVTDESSYTLDRTEDISSVTYEFEVPENIEIYGAVAVHIYATTSLTEAAADGKTLADYDGIKFSASLNDTNSEEFDAFVSSRSYLPYDVIKEQGSWMGAGLYNFNLVSFSQTPTNSKSIANGCIDLYNPTAGYDSYTASTRTELQDGEYYEYVVYLQPNVYTVTAGHTLELELSISTRDLAVTIDNSRTYVEIPVESASEDEGSVLEDDENDENNEDDDTASVNPFVDVVDTEDTHWYYDAVLWAVENGITTGTSDTTFEPDKECTRAEIVTFLWRAAKSPAPESDYNPFEDVEENSDTEWYYDAVLWAVENGITTGTSDTTFEPDTVCSRSQIVTFLWRFAGKEKPTLENNPFTDIVSSDETEWYYDAVLWAVENGITTGTSDTTFEPVKDCTRAEIVTFLYRYFVNE